MTDRTRTWVFPLVGSLAIFLGIVDEVCAQQDAPVVEITDPDRDGLEVGRSKTVKGEADIPSGHHLWVLAHREDFKRVWWPQGEGVIDPETHHWKVQVTFGEDRDVGWNFDIAAH